MPSGSSKDIYRTQGRRKSLLEDSPSSQQTAQQWLRDNSGTRRSTGLFLFAILLFLALLVGVIVYQQRQIQAARSEPTVVRHRPLALAEAARDRIRLDLDPEGNLVLDEWPDRDPGPVGDGPYPLTARWIQEAALHLRRAESAYRAEDWRSALVHYEAALRILPGVEGVAVTRGLSHLRLREFGRAEELFSNVLDAGEADPGVLNNLAVAQMGQGREADALRNLDAAIRADSEYLPARHNMALLQYRAGRFPEAADAFAQVFQRQPLSADHIHLYALTLLKLERWNHAADVLRESVRLYPQAPPIRFRLAEALARTSPEAAVDALRDAVALVDARYAMRWISRSEFDPLRRLPSFEQLVSELAEALP